MRLRTRARARATPCIGAPRVCVGVCVCVPVGRRARIATIERRETTTRATIERRSDDGDDDGGGEISVGALIDDLKVRERERERTREEEDARRGDRDG